MELGADLRRNRLAALQTTETDAMVVMGRYLNAPRILSRYLARAYILRFLILFLGISVVLQLLDVLTASEDILAAEGADFTSILRYIELRYPQLLSEFAPFTALLAALLTYATLNQHSEIVVMKAASLSPFRIITPLMAVSCVIALVHFILNESIVVRSTAELKHWQDMDYAVDTPPPPVSSTRTWVIDGTNLIEVKSVARNGRILVVDNLTQYERDADARLTGVLKADFAVFRDDQWTLFDARRFDLENQTVQTLTKGPWQTDIPPERFLALAVTPDHVSFGELFSAMVRLEDEGYPVRSLAASLHHKIAGPLATVIMPLLAAFAAFGVVRGGKLFIRASTAMGLGFAFFVVDNLMLAMGQFGRVPPSVAAWAPLALFLILGLLVVVFTEE
ncbi:MAG: LPS export ABC transporter permease LptG [Alphaproteobacteria bacterium]|nr:MAG: LPS export ABC transporter permease LptG [Alphaproteobacteria bacterium]